MPPKAIADGNSCLECRRRKIKCDRSYPCSYCVKKKIDCAYPPVRAAVNTVPNTESDILARVERIEQRFASLEQGVSEIKQLLQSWSPTVALQSGKSDHTQQWPRDARGGHDDTETDTVRNDTPSCVDRTSPNVEPYLVLPSGEIGATANSSSPLMLLQSTQDSHSALLFESKKMVDLETIRPPSTMISLLWLKYLENVDRVLKIFHTPTVQKLVIEAIRCRTELDPAQESLLFAIYYATVVGLSVSECYAEFGEERSALLKRYRTGLECSLSRADFAEAPSMITLQAFAIYLITGRRDEEGPDVHSLTGLAIGLAFRLGLHRDAEALKVSPFEVEMRRRLWWQICILDVHTAEEHACDPCVLESSFNTKLPLNVADNSLDPHMSDVPQTMPGKTEMLFSLLQIEISYFARQLLFSKEFVRANSYMAMSGAQKCDAIDLFQRRIENQYLSYCDTKIAFDFVTANFTRFILVKLKLAASQANNNQDDHPGMKENLREICVQILDYSSTIRSCENGLR